MRRSNSSRQFRGNLAAKLAEHQGGRATLPLRRAALIGDDAYLRECSGAFREEIRRS